MPNGSKDELLNIFDRCTRSLQDLPQYKNSWKYVSIWVDYANQHSKPLELFQRMQSKRIGEKLCLFYQAWGAVLENQKDYQGAERVYTLGIQM
jgi:hypothetical protein